MNLGIVGSEQAKFTSRTEGLARATIRILIERYQPTFVVSGKCHLGGIDVYAVEEAKHLKVPFVEFPPKTLEWSAGYKPRNILIAQNSDHVVCITVRSLPAGYTGMRFRSCYHCGSAAHIKSGGCWTVKYAIEHGKTGEVIVID